MKKCLWTNLPGATAGRAGILACAKGQAGMSAPPTGVQRNERLTILIISLEIVKGPVRISFEVGSRRGF